MDPVIVIPALEPGQALVDTVARLRARCRLPIVVVDDGSGPRYGPTFRSVAAVPGVRVIRHVINHGKGAALRAAIAAVLRDTPAAPGVVTADSDGQHAVPDILAVAGVLRANPHALVLGAREFSDDVPLASRLGNGLARWLLGAGFGLALSDTQTGLRGIPGTCLVHLLRLGGARYEFETEMLLWACAHAMPIIEHPIATIYGGTPSHFRPVVDSARVAGTLARAIFRANVSAPRPITAAG